MTTTRQITDSATEAEKTPGQWAAEGCSYDCTGFIGPLFPIYSRENPPKWPMYSFDRPSTILWNAIAAELNKRGWSDKEIEEWLRSKATRWALDTTLGDALTALGKSFAATARKV